MFDAGSVLRNTVAHCCWLLSLLGVSSACQPECNTDIDCPGIQACVSGECVDRTGPIYLEGYDCSTNGQVTCAIDYGTTASPTRVILCESGKWELAFECPDSELCEPHADDLDSVECGDTWYSVAGASCAEDTSQACSEGREKLLLCEDGEWAEAITCPNSDCKNLAGANEGCNRHGCGTCGFNIGDPCVDEGSIACSTDHSMALICESEAWARAFVCPDDQDCEAVPQSDSVRCGGTLYGLAGNLCNGEGDQVCSVDAETVLRCDAGTWTEAIHCAPTSCMNVTSGGNGCTGHWCENCGYTEGDWCSFREGGLKCSTDLAATVTCMDGSVTVEEECPDSTMCTFAGNVVGCE